MKRLLVIVVTLLIVACAKRALRATIAELTTMHVFTPTGRDDHGVLYYSSELGIEPPRLIADAQPQIPLFELATIERPSECFVPFTVTATGEAIAPNFASCPYPNLAPYLAQALKRRRYNPALQHGKAIAVVFGAEVRIALD